MPRFFVDEPVGPIVCLTGETAWHISGSLRMKPGEEITLCDGQGWDYRCRLVTVGQTVQAALAEKYKNQSESSVDITLYQALAKKDKFEQIVQKSVELGVSRIVPVLTARCVSRPDAQTMRKKVERYQKIAREAAKQSGRGRIPIVADCQTFSQALLDAQPCWQKILFYERHGQPLGDLLTPNLRQVAVFIGSEGGFEPSEVEQAVQAGAQIATLGKRILRCETAPLCALSIILYATGNIS